MITALKTLAELLARDPLTVEDVLQHLGAVTENYTGNVLVKPRDPAFTAANVVRQINADIPSHIELTAAEPPTLDELAQEFGRYEELPRHDKFPPRVIFYLDMPGKSFRVALIAAVKGNRATSITLRRDMRL